MSWTKISTRWSTVIKTICSWVRSWSSSVVKCFDRGRIEHLSLHHSITWWMSGRRHRVNVTTYARAGSSYFSLTLEFLYVMLIIAKFKSVKCKKFRVCIFLHKKYLINKQNWACWWLLLLWPSSDTQTHTHCLFKPLQFWYSTHQLFLCITALRFGLRALWMMTSLSQHSGNVYRHMFTHWTRYAMVQTIVPQ